MHGSATARSIVIVDDEQPPAGGQDRAQRLAVAALCCMTRMVRPVPAGCGTVMSRGRES
jgi:hypothetical protein